MLPINILHDLKHLFWSIYWFFINVTIPKCLASLPFIASTLNTLAQKPSQSKIFLHLIKFNQVLSQPFTQNTCNSLSLISRIATVHNNFSFASLFYYEMYTSSSLYTLNSISVFIMAYSVNRLTALMYSDL